ncbi:MAG TPA: chemotaxis protein CheA [Firmicutes bacterium]|nr:chemotaxis protein CheA [Bacillota bacterium]
MSEGIEITQELRQAFISEAQEYVQRLNDCLLELEKNSGDADALTEMFRAAHSLKGMAATMGLDGMADFTHEVESVMQAIKDGKIALDEEDTCLFFAAVDAIENMLDQFAAGNDAPAVRGLGCEQVTAQLKALLEAGTTGEGTEAKVLEHSSHLNGMDHTVKVETAKLDELINLIGQLVIARNRLAAFCEAGDVPEEALQEIDQATSGLQDLAMRLRMMPIQSVFRRFPRMVRDVAAELGKKVRLEISGGDTELDRAVVGRMGEPLVHLLRNAVDHGIEPPAIRKELGKPEEGLVRLSARNEGGRVVVEVQDDGAGIDPQRLLEKAIAKGVVSETEARQLNESQILELIFLPGFSTKEQATEVSGRGVGMDIVRNVIASMNGVVEVDSKPGLGTTIRMHLPITLAIVKAMLLKAQEEIFAVPLEFIVENILLDNRAVKSMMKRPVMEWRGEVLPVVSLREAVGLQGQCTGASAVILQTGKRKAVLEVDEIVGQQEIVMKSIGHFLGSVKGISGATILGDGRVSLILDIASLLN